MNQRGSTLIPLILIGTVAMVLFMSLMSSAFSVMDVQMGADLKIALKETIANFKTCADEGYSWSNTIADTGNPNALRCLRSAVGCGNVDNLRIRLRTIPIEGQPPRHCIKDYDSLRPTAGFSPTGDVCDTFSLAGNDACPYKIEFFWSARCPGGATPCLLPIQTLIGSITYRPIRAGLLAQLRKKISGSLFAGRQTFEMVIGSGGIEAPVVLLERQPAGVSGGACAPFIPTLPTPRRRINLIQSDPLSLATVNPAARTFTLKQGTYECTISAPAYQTGQTILRLVNLSAGNSVLVQSGSQTSNGFAEIVQTRTSGTNRFNLADTSTLALQQFCATQTSDPLDQPMAMGIPFGVTEEIYSYVKCHAMKETL